MKNNYTLDTISCMLFPSSFFPQINFYIYTRKISGLITRSQQTDPKNRKKWDVEGINT